MTPPRSPRRVPVPSRLLLRALLPAGVLALGTIWFGAAEVLWRSWLVLLGCYAALELLQPPRRGAVTATRELAGDHRVGRVIAYTLRLENTSLGALDVLLREVLPPAFEPNEVVRELRLAGGGSFELRVETLALERGAFRLEPTTLRVRRPLGLFEWRESGPARDELVILPGRPASEMAVLLTRTALLEERGEHAVRRRGHDRDFESLRDYVRGDDWRFIDWKATARRFRPQVRQFQMERNAEIVLAVDCGRLMGNLVRGIRKLDLAITAVLDLAAVVTQRKERVGLLAFDAQVLSYLPPRGGTRQVSRLADALARLAADYREPSYTRAVAHLEAHQRKRSVIVVFTDFADELSSADLQAALAGLAKRHVILFVAVGDPHLEDIVEESPRVVEAVFQKAAAAELLTERRRVVRAMNRLGVLTVDAEPQKLTAPVIRKYLEARERL